MKFIELDAVPCPVRLSQISIPNHLIASIRRQAIVRSFVRWFFRLSDRQAITASQRGWFCFGNQEPISNSYVQ